VVAEAAIALDDAASGAVAGAVTAAEVARLAPARADLPAAAGRHPDGLATAPASGHAMSPEDNAGILPDGPRDQNSGSSGLVVAAAGLDVASGGVAAAPGDLATAPGGLVDGLPQPAVENAQDAVALARELLPAAPLPMIVDES